MRQRSEGRAPAGQLKDFTTAATVAHPVDVDSLDDTMKGGVFVA